MADARFSDAELDALIESALRDEPLLPVPVGLHARVAERVHWAALQQKERARFRNTLLTGLAGSAGIITLAVLFVGMTSFHVLLEHGVSGGLGLMDYYRTTLHFSWLGQLDGLILAIGAALAVITAGAALQPLRRSGPLRLASSGKVHDSISGRSMRAR